MSIRVDGSVLAFTMLVALRVGFFLALATVLLISRVEPNKDSQRNRHGRCYACRAGSSQRLIIVVAQVMFTLILLVCAGLAIQGFVPLATVYRGKSPVLIFLTH
ncbi:MAG: hypothetical protein AUG46_06695 [Acidobacteria bacterium 13_1_20CM_3_58_11]|nr:MAG: hypothetical protein AUG46_06695 [Acidobacteria bacterium 13_1_20CM_3_58_11]